MPNTDAPVLVVGASGRVGSGVTGLLLDAGVPVRALTHRAEATEDLPAGAEAVAGDLTVPQSLDHALEGVGAVFLVWTAPPHTVGAVVERLASHGPRVVFLSAPFRTPHPFFQQPKPMATLYAQIEDLVASSGIEMTVIRPGMFASNALSWWRRRSVPVEKSGGRTAQRRRRPSTGTLVVTTSSPARSL